MAEQTYYESKPSGKILVNWLFTKLSLSLLTFGFVYFIFFIELESTRIGSWLFTRSLGKIILSIIFVIIAMILLYLNFLYKTYVYRVTDKGIYFKGGIIVREDKFVPFFKITDVKTSQNIIEQILGIKKLGFQTAGQTAGRYGYFKPEIEFEGLEDAEKPKQLVYQLIEKTKKASKYDE